MRKFLTCLLALSLAAFSHGTTPQSGGGPKLQIANIYGASQAIRQNPAQYYVPGVSAQAISTSDWYHLDGVYWFRPYDILNTDCGSTGATIAASKGRYFWVASVDHPDPLNSWTDGRDFRAGFSSDPGIPPVRMDTIVLFSNIIAAPQVASITGYIDNGSGSAGTVLHVVSVTGTVTFQNGANTVNGAGVTASTGITGQSTGTPAGVGTYTVNNSQLVGSSGSPVVMTINQKNYALYEAPYFVCNPDDGSNPFYLYAEGSGSSIQHQEGLAKSSDLVNWTVAGPSHVNWTFNNWSSFERIVRTGVNTWHSTGFQAFFFPTGPNVFGDGEWTSSDGNTFTISGSLFNVCLPPNSTGTAGAQPCPDTPSSQAGFGPAPDTLTIAGQAYGFSALDARNNSSGMFVSRVPVDSSFNVLSSPAVANISAAYTGVFPGPTYLQDVAAYVEDGIAHYYAETGFFTSSSNVGTTSGIPYHVPASVTGSISTTTLTVASASPGSIPIPGGLNGAGVPSNITVTAQVSGTPGGAGVYTLNGSGGTGCPSSCSLTIYGGGLWQEGIDYYTEIIDATAAASAAPVGVQASCNNDVATLTWYDALPTRNYRVYRGTTAGSQTMLLATINDVTYFDTSPPDQAVSYYKIVTMNAGVEEKPRVVSTYCSSSSAFVNAHITRALAAGAVNINRSWLDTVYNWLVTNNLYNDLLMWTDTGAGVVESSGTTIQTVMDLGTTRLPRSGDYTTNTTNTAYSATAVNSTAAGWVNSSTTFAGYYGGPAVANGAPGRINTFRRLREITAVAAYQKTSTVGDASLLYSGVSGGTGVVALEHLSGSPGSISFAISDATHTVTATATISGSGTAAHIAAGTFDGANLCAYSDGISGICQTGLVIPSFPTTLLNSATDALTGQVGSSNNVPLLGSGSVGIKYQYGTGYVFGNGSTAFSASELIVFDVALTSSQMSSLTAMLKTHLGL